MATRCLLAKDVDYELRETFESAMRFGRETLMTIGIDADRAAIVEDFIRTRDRDRLAVQQAEGIYGGLEMLRTRPTPIRPQPPPDMKRGRGRNSLRQNFRYV